MLSLKHRGLLDKGEYFVVGIDIEQYDASAPDKYLRGLLQDKTDAECHVAFKSYLGIVPSPTINFDEFSKQVSSWSFEPTSKYINTQSVLESNPIKMTGNQLWVHAWVWRIMLELC